MSRIEDEEEELELLANERRLKMESQRKELELQIELENKKADLKKRKLAREKELVAKKLEFEQAKIDDGDFSDHSQELSDDDKLSHHTDSENSKKAENWVNSSPFTAKEKETGTTDNQIPIKSDEYNVPFDIPDQRQKDAPVDKMEKFFARQTMGKDLPVFNGEAEEWPGFIEEYKMSTELCRFSDGENLNRLRKCLRGKAKETVQAMLISPKNVSKVIDTLKRNFGQPETIVKTLVAKAKGLPAPKEDKPQSVIDFANAVRNMVTTMEALGSDNYLQNPQLRDELVEKLPITYQKDWAILACKSNSQNLQQFSTWMDEVADAANILKTLKVSYDKPSGHPKNDNRRPQAVFSTTTETKPSTCTCEVCGKKGHNVSKCFKFAKFDCDSKWEWITDKKNCFCCLFGKHHISSCPDKRKCDIDGCPRYHHVWLHKKVANAKTEDELTKSDEVQNKPVFKVTSRKGTVLLSIVPVIVRGPAGELKTYAMLDGASTTTLIESELADKLRLTGPTEPFEMSWTNNTTHREENSRRVNLTVRGVDSTSKYQLKEIHTVNNLALPSQTLDKKMIDSWTHLKETGIKSFYNAKPQILIGRDNNHLVVDVKTVEGPRDSPAATLTRLGWTVTGNGKLNTTDSKQYAFHIYDNSDDELHQLVNDSFRTETFGVKVKVDKILSREEKRVEEISEATTKIVGDRWETGLIWRDDDVKFPESKSAAMSRLLQIERRMDKDKEFGQQYSNKIDDYLAKGYARKLTAEESTEFNPKTFYLPHFGVVKASKPGKLRLVFDAASKANGISLNDQLLKGLDLLNPLPSVLFKFRQRRIGFCADIREMFHQIRIRKDDLPAQRFLWRGWDRQRPPDIMEMSVLIFGAASSPFSAQDVKNRNARQYETEFPEAAKAIIHRHYMDDYLDSADDVETSMKIINDVIEVHRRGGFEICNWNCSSTDVINNIPEELVGEKLKNLNPGTDGPTEQVLGLLWNPRSDYFSFNTAFNKIPPIVLQGIKMPTKRQLLSIVMSVFDPLGFLVHFVVKARILIQDVWASKIGWDDELPATLLEKWKMWLEELHKICEMKIPRCYASEMDQDSNVQLHIFCDASDQAFAAVGYFRVKTRGEIQTSFVMGKARVASTKPMSIPRKELQAAVLGSRLADTIKMKHEIIISKTFFWSDSRTVLCWLRSDVRRFKTFVAHRISEIEELSDITDWHWVPTKDNVADEATRDGKMTDLRSSSRWLHGPDFLKLDENLWPKETNNLQTVPDEEQELKKEFVALLTSTDKSVPDVGKCSSYRKINRIVAWQLRFIRNCKAKKKPDERTRRAMTKARREGVSLFQFVPELNVAELTDAELFLLKTHQQHMFPEEISLLRKGKPVQRGSRLSQLSPVIDSQGLLRVKGRTENAPELLQDCKMPIILDPRHRLTILLVRHYHENANHHGQERVVNELRQRYWILDLRAAVKKSWHDCRICKAMRDNPPIPEMAPLPACRLTRQNKAFAVTAVDYFGPMEVAIGRRREKRYGALFTCMTTRAVHIEVAASLTTDSAILAIRRFICRRGCPTDLYSDNGTNIRGADTEMKTALAGWNQNLIESELAQKGIQWHFIPPGAPHMAGSWERLVRSVKTALKATLKERVPREEVLLTLMAEAEYTVNCRPLTHVSVDPDDPESLTPNHFLIGNSSGNHHPGRFCDRDLNLRKQWRVAERLADHFWRRWLKEYLPTLTKREKWQKSVKAVELDDIVLIVDENLTRNRWPKGKIIGLHPGKDGQTRVVDIKTQHGEMRRPVAKIVILDVSPDEDVLGLESQYGLGNVVEPSSRERDMNAGELAPTTTKKGRAEKEKPF